MKSYNNILNNLQDNESVLSLTVNNIDYYDDNKLIGVNCDPQIILTLNKSTKYIYFKMNLESNDTFGIVQIFYSGEGEDFSEKHCVNISKKDSCYECYLELDRSASKLRIDPISSNEKFEILDFQVLTISEEEYKNSIEDSISEPNSTYDSWKIVNELTDNRKKYLFDNLSRCDYKPLISIIIPIYNPSIALLKKALDSVKNQMYTNWEICIVDDCSTHSFVRPYLNSIATLYKNVSVAFNEVNSHISVTTNNAVDNANGDYLIFLDQDDVLTEDALMEVVLYLNKYSCCDLLYSDDDKIDIDDNCFAPQFKPSWSPEYLISFMYCGHLKCVKKSLFDELGGFRKGYEGSQDYDFYLRAAEKAKHVGHIPRILYHWRVVSGSTAAGGNEKDYSFQAGIDAVQDALDRRKIYGRAYQPEWAAKNGNGIYAIDFPHSGPSVGIIIPTKNGLDLLRRCVSSLGKTNYTNFKIYIIDNESDEIETIDYLDSLTHCEILKIKSPNGKFSFSYINNEAVKHVDEEFVLFLNNDTEIINPNWLSQMVGYLQFKGVGSVGARLLFPDNRIQHAGIIHGLTHGFPITSGRLLNGYEWGELASTVTSKNFAAVTAACMLTPKALFEKMGGFDDRDFSVAFNDCDYGYRLHMEGYRSVLAPEALLYHYEGASRGHGDKPVEESAYISKYGSWKDPYYNPNLSMNCSDYSVDSKTVVLHDVPKFRVMMVTHNLNLEGAPKSFYEIVKGVKRAGLIEPVVVSHKDGPLAELYKKENIEVIVIDNFNLFSLHNDCDVEEFLNKQLAFIDSLNVSVIYGNTVEACWAIQCAKKLNLPSIWNIRESEDPPFAPYNGNPLIKSMMVDSMQYPYKVVFVADATQVVYQQLNSENNFMTIYNGFDEEIANEKGKSLDRKAIRHELGVEDDELLLLTLGTVCERKGQKDIVYAIRELSDKYVNKIKICIVGDRKSLDYSKELHKLIGSLDEAFRNRISVVDETSDIHRYYIASDIFVCSSRVESFPKVIQEAMYYRLAIITTPVFGIVEQVKNNTSALYYNPGDIDMLKNHITNLVDDDRKRERISFNAKVALNILPDISNMAAQYESIFKEAWLSGKSR